MSSHRRDSRPPVSAASGRPFDASQAHGLRAGGGRRRVGPSTALRRRRSLCTGVAGAAIALLLAVAGAGCAPQPTLELRPEEARAEIGRLEARLEERPGDVRTLRDLGTLYVLTDRLERGQSLLLEAFEGKMDDPKTRFYLGLARERSGAFGQALRLYQGFADVGSGSPYRRALRGRHDLVLRRLAQQEAERDVARCLEAGRCAGASPTTVAVLPLRFQGGDERFARVGRGLAELVSIDLSRVERLTVVERVRLQALLAEIERSQGAQFRADVGPRTGRLLGAGQLVGGAFTVQDERDLRLSMRLASVDGRARDLETGSSALARLFELQKRIVFRIVEELGIELTPAEREGIQAVPTQNLQAFLAFSRGLDFDDRGEYVQAAGAFRRAREIDPSFQMAASREAETAALADATAGRLPTPVVSPSINLTDLRLGNMPSTGGPAPAGSERDPDGEFSGAGGTLGPQPLPLPPPPSTGNQ